MSTVSFNRVRRPSCPDTTDWVGVTTNWRCIGALLQLPTFSVARVLNTEERNLKSFFFLEKSLIAITSLCASQ